MIKVLFICHGNICRSPMAEFIFKDMIRKQGIEDRFHVESRATHTDEIWNGQGNPVYPPAKEELKKHNISCKGKYARLLVKSDYNDYDYIIGMDDENVRWMSRILGVPFKNRGTANRGEKLSLLLDYSDNPRSVADPWYTRDFTTTYNDIVEGCECLIKYLTDTFAY